MEKMIASGKRVDSCSCFLNESLFGLGSCMVLRGCHSRFEMLDSNMLLVYLSGWILCFWACRLVLALLVVFLSSSYILRCLYWIYGLN